MMILFCLLNNRSVLNLLGDGQFFFFIGRVTIFGIGRQLFLRKNAFQTIFSLHSVMKRIFDDHFEKHKGFVIHLIQKRNTSSVFIHMHAWKRLT